MILVGELISNCKDNQLVLHLMKILWGILKNKEEGSRVEPILIVSAFAKHILSYNDKKRKEDYELIMVCTISILDYCTKEHKEALKICTDNIIYGLNSEFNEYTQPSLDAMDAFIRLLISFAGISELHEYPSYLENLINELLALLRNTNANIRQQSSSILKDLMQWIPMQANQTKEMLSTAIPIMVYNKNEKALYKSLFSSVAEILKSEEEAVSKFCRSFSKVFGELLGAYIDEKGPVKDNLHLVLKHISERQTVFSAYHYMVALKSEQLTRLEVLKEVLLKNK